MENQQGQLPFDIVPTHLAVKAMRDSGYRNAAYALAELVDNAVQAEATQIEILCGDEVVELDYRRRTRVKLIGVLDNGYGMDAEILRIALQFGNGLYLDPEFHTGIGRFGMGLPSSSVSQCKRVDVWSWRGGIESAFHTYIDLDDIESGQLREVPVPQPSAVPDLWIRVGQNFEDSGTLIVWSKVDRCMWKTSRAIIRNSELFMGRIYRRFIQHGQTAIRFVAFDLDHPNTLDEHYARPNDPGYLMEETSCPPPFDNEPMFMPYPSEEAYEITYVVSFRGQDHEVKMRFSVAKESAREGYNPGANPHGRHAAKNVGVSLMRADRELDLDAGWSDPSEPRDRWWGVEIDFPPALDDLFGVTNNKQSARNFSEMATLNLDSLLEEGQTFEQLKAEMEEDEDPRLPLLEITQRIESNISVMRRLLRAQTSGTSRRRKRHGHKSSPQAIATEATKKRKEDGYFGESDKEEELPDEERKGQVKESLVKEGIPEENAEELAATTVYDGLKYIFDVADLEGPAFFTVQSRGGVINVLLNSNHPAYERLVEVLEEEVESEDQDTLKSRLRRARDGLELLLMAWARYEDEQPYGQLREKAENTRWDWGRVAKDFLRQD